VLGHEVGVGAQAVTCALDLDDDGMVQQAIEQGRCHHRIPEHLWFDICTRIFIS